MTDDRESAFVGSEYRRLITPDDCLRTLCMTRAAEFLPERRAAAPSIARTVKRRLADGIPTSLLRVGDGEGNVLGVAGGDRHPIHLAAFNDKFSAMDGTRLGLEEARSLCKMISSALHDADIIGFRSFDPPRPEPDMILADLAEGRPRAALGILYARAMLQDALLRNAFADKIVTSAWIHLSLIAHLPDIMAAAASVIVVTGRVELRSAFDARLRERLRDFIAVPAEGQSPASEAQSHYRLVFPRVMEYLRQDLCGVLVLVGAGFLGKLYCQVAKASGAVAIDLGSAFDVMAGVRTRPIHSLVDIDALSWL